MHSNPHMFMERKDFIKQFLILAGVKNSLFSLNLSKWSQITNLKIHKYISRQNLNARVPKYLIRLSALSSNPLLAPSHPVSPSAACLMACFPEKGRQSSEEFQSGTPDSPHLLQCLFTGLRAVLALLPPPPPCIQVLVPRVLPYFSHYLSPCLERLPGAQKYTSHHFPSLKNKTQAAWLLILSL